MEFNKGSELDKQIYKEGEPTWGCKSGVLDVEDVKEAIKKLKNCICYCGEDEWSCGHCMLIKGIFGEKLIQ